MTKLNFMLSLVPSSSWGSLKKLKLMGSDWPNLDHADSWLNSHEYLRWTAGNHRRKPWTSQCWCLSQIPKTCIFPHFFTWKFLPLPYLESQGESLSLCPQDLPCLDELQCRGIVVSHAEVWSFVSHFEKLEERRWWNFCFGHKIGQPKNGAKKLDLVTRRHILAVLLLAFFAGEGIVF